MDNTANAPAGAAGTAMLASIGIIFLVIGIGIGYMVFSAPSAGNTATAINSTVIKYVETGNYTINEDAIKAQLAAFNRVNELRGAGISLTYQSARLDDDGLIEALVLDNSTGSAAKVYFSKTNKYISIVDVSQPFPIDVINYSVQMEAAIAANATAQASSINKTDRPKVELFVMSYCPYGTQEEKGVIPAVEALKGKIDFSVKFVYYSMHGKTEIDENTRQYCIQKEQGDRYIPYLVCFLNDSNYSRCIVSANVSSTPLNACMNATDAAYNITGLFNDQASWLEDQGGNPAYPLYMVNMADNQKYGVQGSPTLVINGAEASSGRDSASVLSAICNAFNAKPGECGTTLSSAAPSAGFGYTGTGDAGAAQCGG
jgi:hypothetical protein